MPDRSHAFPSQAATGTTVSKSVVVASMVSPVVFPLDDFYARAGLCLPAIERVEAGAIPEPYRGLLAHNEDMTPTLSAFHASVIQLRVLGRQQRGDFYSREVVLFTDETNIPVEFGAIRINLGLFGPAVRRHILDERVPLGDLLRVHAVPHASRPKAFFRLEADALMCEALQLPEPRILYGRRNTLFDPVKRPLAEVVEILPPSPRPDSLPSEGSSDGRGSG